MGRQQGRQSLIKVCAGEESAGVAQNHGKEVDADSLVAEPDLSAAPIHLPLSSGAGFEPHDSIDALLKLFAQVAHQQLHHLVSAGVALLLELAEQDGGVEVYLLSTGGGPVIEL